MTPKLAHACRVWLKWHLAKSQPDDLHFLLSFISYLQVNQRCSILEQEVQVFK